MIHLYTIHAELQLLRACVERHLVYVISFVGEPPRIAPVLCTWSLHSFGPDQSISMDSSTHQSSSSASQSSSYQYLKTRKDSKLTNGTEKIKPAIDVSAIVNGVIDDVRAEGDVAVRRYSEKFDKWSPKSFQLSEREIKDIIATVPEQTMMDIIEVQKNVRKFAEAQLATLKELELEIQPGVFLGHKNVPIASVGA